MYRYLILVLLLVTLTACKAQNGAKDKHTMGDHKYTNELIKETSPYLLQHAHNPVNWTAWKPEVLEKAKQEDKLLIISVGYAACHWCHVMEHESFEDSTVAAVMNEHFVPIKVDREERPDVDQIYMDACHLMNNRGGWPLNAIALPDGRPIFAGTYFKKDQWLQILEHYRKQYEEDREMALEMAGQVEQGIRNMDNVPKLEPVEKFRIEDLDRIFHGWESSIDFQKGGKKGAPKFPMPNNYLYLLRYQHIAPNDDALKAALITMDHMANGGIYDHVGGGFARYSVDAEWHVPHFEKMMYDNGQLVSLYSEAYQLTKKQLYKSVVEETLDWVAREMTSPEGGFYSSLDADSDGEEGKYYVFTKEESDSLLGENAALFCETYDIIGRGNWEHEKNVLRKKNTFQQVADRNEIHVNDLQELLDEGKQILYKFRETRVRPGLDDKILTGWNALMLKGYVDAYRVFDNREYLEIAETNAKFLLKNMMQSDGRLNRNYKEGKSNINAFLDDYGLLIDALIALYQATMEETYLKEARKLADYVLAHFSDEESGMFFYTSDLDAPLITRKLELSDNVIPGSNSVMAKALYELGIYFYDENYIAISRQMLSNMEQQLYRQGRFFTNWAWLMTYFVKEPHEVAIIGDNFEGLRKEMDQTYLPHVLLSGGKQEGSLQLLKNKLIEGQTTIYVCQQKVCKFPVTEVEKALKLMKE